jgi:hypothetical protein
VPALPRRAIALRGQMVRQSNYLNWYERPADP